MEIIKNYFFIDGSALIAQIRNLTKKKKQFKNRKLSPELFVQYFQNKLGILLAATYYKRAVFYFPNGDTSISQYLKVPDFKKPGSFYDISFKYCGQRIRSSKVFNKLVSDKIPQKWHDRFTKSEKGVDIEICCDALKLASKGNIDRLFLLTNDANFIPFCRTIKEFGANINLIHLSEETKPNESLVQETDSYNTVPAEDLEAIFISIQI